MSTLYDDITLDLESLAQAVYQFNLDRRGLSNQDGWYKWWKENSYKYLTDQPAKEDN